MSVPLHDLGLRERKKAQTRAAIQRAALELFGRQGYAATTTVQIAAAASISSATFFRYFPTKEDVVLFDALDFTMQEADEPPEDLSPIEAVRWVLATAFATLTAEEVRQQRERYALIQSVPELRARMADEIVNNMGLLAAVIAKRTNKKPTDTVVRTLAGAILGVTLTTLLEAGTNPHLDYVAALDTNLSCLETSMKH